MTNQGNLLKTLTYLGLNFVKSLPWLVCLFKKRKYYTTHTVLYTDSKLGENISQGFSFIWAQTLRQGIFLVPAEIIALSKFFYLHPNKFWRLHLVYVKIGESIQPKFAFLPFRFFALKLECLLLHMEINQMTKLNNQKLKNSMLAKKKVW